MVTNETFNLIAPVKDLEIQPRALTCATYLEEPIPTSDRLQHFSTFTDAMLLQQTTLMAEVTDIMNAKPHLPVSEDPLNPFILSPSMPLALANQFWTPPNDAYLPSLLHLQVGDLVLLSNKQTTCNKWPTTGGLAMCQLIKTM